MMKLNCPKNNPTPDQLAHMLYKLLHLPFWRTKEKKVCKDEILKAYKSEYAMGRHYYAQGRLIYEANYQLQDEFTALQKTIDVLVQDAMRNDPDVGKTTQ